jgi:hypothetical protein
LEVTKNFLKEGRKKKGGREGGKEGASGVGNL